MTAIVAGSLYTSLRIAFRARSAAETSAEPVRTAGVALSLLRADFESAAPASGTLFGPFIGLDSAGAAGQPADALEFHCLGDPGDALPASAQPEFGAAPGATVTGAAATFLPPGVAEARKVQLLVETYPGPNGSQQQVLVRRVTTNLLSPVTPEPYEEVVCRGVRAVNIRYHDGLLWQDSWDSTQLENNIPTAVELTLELERLGPDGQPKVMRFPRVYRLTTSKLIPGVGLMGLTGETGSGATGGTTP